QLGPSVLDGELPIGERGDHADRTVGEVEDARRDVGDGETGGGQRIDAASGDTRNGETKEDVHVRRSLTTWSVDVGAVTPVAGRAVEALELAAVDLHHDVTARRCLRGGPTGREQSVRVELIDLLQRGHQSRAG